MPSSIVPIVSTVTETMTGSRARDSSKYSKIPQRAAFDLKNILARFDAEKIRSALDQSPRLLFVRGGHLLESDVAERREFRGGSHRAGHEPGMFGCGEFPGHAPGDLRGFHVQLVGTVRETVFRQDDRGTAERVGLDDVAAGLRGSRGGRFPRPGTGNHQIFVAAVKVFSAEIVGGEVLPLKVRPGRTVKDDDLLLLNA